MDAQEVAQLTVVDLQGRVVYTNKVMGASQTHNKPISMRGQDSGTFVVRSVSNKRILTGKIVLIR
ncbi:T9SS type A sorting domain-containing protein [Fibrella sp. WM1]|uniref:T9SS type A sorting domain-containing protein n=1 Tax=Fibrella musci TaxID=3242485 RepID=UPI00352256BE